MSAHQDSEVHESASTRLFIMVWIGLLVLTGIEVFLAYERLPVNTMLILLVGLSVIKSVLIIAYFMHLKYEKMALTLLIMPAFIFCICVMMAFSFPDGFRALRMHP